MPRSTKCYFLGLPTKEDVRKEITVRVILTITFAEASVDEHLKH